VNGDCMATGINLGTPLVFDNCGVQSVSNNAPIEFLVGTTIVTWTVTDNSGNTTTANQYVTVIDNEAPVANLNDITVQLDESGNVSIEFTDIDAGSSDNGEIVNFQLSQSE